MFYYKINNLIKQNGQCDYKGLDIEKIIGGTQRYDKIEQQTDNWCILASEENLDETTELIKLTENEYLDIIEELNIERELIAQKMARQKEEELKQQQQMLQQINMVPELEAKIRLMQQALDEMILGGEI